MVIFYRQGKESFIGEILNVQPLNQIPRCGVSILTKKVLWYELFDYSGMHSLFEGGIEAVAMGILYYGLKCLQIHAQTVHDTNRLGHC
jgi:hypothetical protein